MKFRVHPVESGAHIFHFANAVVVPALAQSRAAKVEAQHGKAKTVQRLHSMEYDFVVQGAAEERMRVANHSRVSCILRASIKQRFQPSCGPCEKKGFDGGVGSAHVYQ